MIIAIDFDGTICQHRFPEIGKEIPGAIDYMIQAQAGGNKIIIWTCREEPYIQPMLDWLKDRQFIPDAVNENIEKGLDFGKHKIYADLYIDDRAVSPPWIK